MERRTYLRSACVVGGLTVAGCLDNRAAGSSDYDVGMSTDSFRPETVTIQAGETVVWRNTSKQGHTVTGLESSLPEDAAYFASGDFESEEAARTAWTDNGGGRIAQGQTYEHAFEVPGTYEYICIPHVRVGMVGTVEVE